MTTHASPVPAVISAIDTSVRDNHLFTFTSSQALCVAPGQFVEITVPGVGGFPVSASALCGERTLESCIRRAGRVTSALYTLAEGDSVGIRGPFGNGFPLAAFEGRDALLIAGGLGMAPLRGLLQALLSLEERVGQITLLYGSRDPDSILFRSELEALACSGRARVQFTVDFYTELPWTSGDVLCRVGLVNTLLDGLSFSPESTTAAVCGPPALYGCVLEELAALGVNPDCIYATLERRMRCGIGQCCHCATGGIFICQEGPVFNLSRLRKLPGAI